MGKRRLESGSIHFADYRTALGVELVYGNRVTHVFTRHTHRTLGFGLVEQGLRIFECQGKSYQIEPGQVFIIPPYCEHICKSANNQPHTYRLLHIADEVLAGGGLINCNFRYIFSQLVINKQEVFEGLQELFDMLAGDESELAKKTQLLTVIGGLLEHYAQTAPPSLALNPDINKAICEVQNYIETNYAVCISLEAIAEIAHISPYHLLRLFSKIVGIPPHIFQQQVRIRKAKELLGKGYSILDTAMHTGFADQSHFTRVFKKLVGITPGEYIS